MSIMLNSAQQQAVDCNDKKILCLACAGAGKTQVLISRLWRLVSENDVDPRSILCLTFTRAAAFEMRARYEKLQKASNEAMTTYMQIKPEISTFHAFCYSLVLHDADVRNKIGYKRPPKILEPASVKKYQKEAILQTNVKLPIKKLSRNIKRTRSEEQEFRLYDKAFRRLLKQKNLITFDILCEDVCKLFHSSDDCIAKYLQRYKYIMIDEFQDTDATQVKFMESFKDSSWFCVGDALQNLYSFRGTSNRFIKDYSQDDSWTKIRMDRNYRSTKQICAYANNESVYANPQYRIELVSDKTGEDVVEQYITQSDYSTEPVNQSELYYLLSHIVPNHQTAILCRTNAEVECICNFLEDHDVEYTTSKRDSTLENILRSSIDDQYLMDWLSTYMSSDKYANYIRLKTLEPNPNVKWFVSTFGDIYWIHTYLRYIAVVRKRALAVLSNQMSVKDMISEISELFKLDLSSEVDYSNLTVKEAIEALIAQINETNLSEVYCGTVHSVKGLEFDDVIISGVKGKHFKLNSEDNLNVYYVAITRAKEHLVVMLNS